MRDGGVGLCPFCRTPSPTSEAEIIKRNNTRAKLGDAESIFGLGCHYAHGMYGLPQDDAKALELYYRVGELGHAAAYFNIGCAYDNGDGVERDENKAMHHYELAAIGGHIIARHNLGCSECEAGNYDRALKHFMLAAGCGSKESLSTIQEMFKNGVATKEDYTQSLRAYQAYLGEIKSAQRDEAAAANENYKYY